MTNRVLGGLHVGAAGLYGVLMTPDGEVLDRANRSYSDPDGMLSAYREVTEQLASATTQSIVWTVALEKPHHLLLSHRALAASGQPHLPTIIQPALSATLIGAIPGSPGLIASLGREVRMATVDAGLSYREYRIQEGGGAWWQRELVKLSEHSQRLRLHLGGKPPTLQEVPRLLEMGRFPTPDPVLKPRLEKIAERLVAMVITLSERPPGLKRFTTSGYLARSALGELVCQRLKALSPHLRLRPAPFPPEVGAALSGLALETENWERDHLGKELFVPDLDSDEWSPPKTIIRRLFRLRRPFEAYR